MIGGRSAYASRGESVATATAAPWRAAAGSGRYWIVWSGERVPTITIAHGPSPAPIVMCAVPGGQCR